MEKAGEDHVLRTPVWMTVIRGFQFLLSLIVLALAGRIMHDAYLDEEGFCVAMGVLTWLAVAYIVLSEKIPGLNALYHIIAVIVLDGLFMILWLACFAATAARRAKFKYSVEATNCSNDGSLLDSESCTVVKRDVILFKSGMAMLAAAAGVGALVWLLFIATFVWTLMGFLNGRKQGRFAMDLSTTATAPSQNYQMENKVAEAQPMNSPQGYNAQVQPGAPYQDNAPAFTQVNTGYAPQDGQFQQPPPAQSPYQNQPYAPPPAQGYPPQDPASYGQQYPPQQDFQQQQNFQQQQTYQTQQQQQQYTTPPPVATSPPPPQTYGPPQ